MAGNVDRIDSAFGVMRPTHVWTAIMVAFLSLSAAARASEADADAEMFSLSGFGTLGVVHSSEQLADFGPGIFVPKGAGYTREWSPEVDSRLGMQLTGNFTSQFSATLQLVAEQNYDGKYKPHVEWANIKYQLTSEFSVRLGRIALASFLLSDSRKVGYAMPWVRPPLEVYGLVPVGNSDGVDASYKLQLGTVTHNLQGSFGQSRVKAVDGTTSIGSDQWVLSDTIEFGPATLRMAYQQVYLTSDGLSALFDVFRQFGAQGVAIADQYDPHGKRVSTINIGAMYDPGDWFAMAEWGTADFRSVIGKRAAWYVTTGYRVRTLTPYVTYASTKAGSNTSDPGLDVSILPPPLVGPAFGLNAALNGILGAIPVQHSVSVGARWDFLKNVDLKLQFDRLNLGKGSAGVLSNVQPGFVPGATVNLSTLTVDFVW